MLSGKINAQNDWNATLRLILDSAPLESSVLTVMSDGISGSIGIRNGRYITGGVATDGSYGVAAVRQIMSITEGFYNYLSDEAVANKREINQGLNVDIAVLLNLQPPPAAPQGQQQGMAGAMKPGDEATTQLRKTLQALTPVSKRNAELAAQQAQMQAPNAVPPQMPPPAVPPQMPPPAVQGPASGQYPAMQGRPSGQFPAMQQGPAGGQPGAAGGAGAAPQQQGPASGQYPAMQARPSGQFPAMQQGPAGEQPGAASGAGAAPQQQGPVSGQYPSMQGRPSGQFPAMQQGPAGGQPGGAGAPPQQQGPASGQYPSMQGRPSGQFPAMQQGPAGGQPGGAGAPPQQQGPASGQMQGRPSGQFPAMQQGPAGEQPGAAGGAGGAPPQQQGPASGQYPAMQGRPSGQFPAMQQGPAGEQPGAAGGAGQQGRSPLQQALQGRPSGQFPAMQGNPQGAPGSEQRPSGQFPVMPDPAGANPEVAQSWRPSGQYAVPQGMAGQQVNSPNPEVAQSWRPSGQYAVPQTMAQRGDAESHPSGGNALDKMVYGAASTFMKLTALKHREPQGGASAQTGGAQAASSTAHGDIKPHTVPDQTPFGIEDMAEPTNVVDAVRATAWKIASRVAHAAKNRMETEERMSDVKRLRTVETDNAVTTEIEKKKRKRWPPDGVTLAMYAAFALGGIVVLGLIYMGIQAATNKPNLVIAKKYMGEGREELALNQLTIQLQSTPDDQDALQLRAQVYENRKDYEHAGEDYSKLFQLKPKVLANARKAAFNEYKAGKYAEATQLCKQIIERQSDDESAKAILAMGLARTDNAAEATKVGAQLDVELVPPYLVSDYFAALGSAYSKLNDNQKAIAYYGRAVKADPKNTEVISERAAAFTKLKDYKHAAADYAALTKIDPANPNHYLALAKACAAAGDFNSAAQAYENAIKLRPTAEIFTALAQAHMQVGKFGYAVAECDSALSLEPTNKQAAALRLHALAKAKGEKAVVIATIEPDYVPGRAKKRTGPAPDTTHDPLTPQGYNALIDGNYSHAITILKQAIARTPGDTGARRYLANALVQADRNREAYDQYVALSQVGALLPSDNIPYAECAVKAGSPERGMEIYFQTLAKDPTFTQARVNLIRLMVARGYQDKAAQQAAEGIRVNPDNKKAFEDALLKDK